MNPQFYKSGHRETSVQFPPSALRGSSNMLLDSVAGLVSWDGGVFFDFGGAFAAGLTVPGEKMSSSKIREETN